jgi:hypothetical protein
MAKYMLEAQKNPGFFTDAALKTSYRTATRVLLCQNAVSYMDGCISSNPFLYKMSNREKFEHTKAMLEEQLSRCRTWSRQQTYDVSAPKYQWSGKVDATGAIQTGYNDDLAITAAAGFHFWPQAMGGVLPGFPYTDVGMAHIANESGETKSSF